MWSGIYLIQLPVLVSTKSIDLYLVAFELLVVGVYTYMYGHFCS